MSLISVSRGKFVLEFLYRHSVVALLKKVPGRKFDPGSASWSLEPSISAANVVLELVQKYGFDITDEAKEIAIDFLEQEAEIKRLAEAGRDPENDIVELKSNLGVSPFPYQKIGISFISKVRRCLIGDEMGLGKSGQALGGLEESNAFPAIIVCPASLKSNWLKESRQWLPHRSAVAVNNGKTDIAAIAKYADIIVINYELLASVKCDKEHKEYFPHVKTLKEIKPAAIVCDESHYIKNSGSLRSAACKELSKVCDVRILLSGTPITIKTRDLAEQLKFLGVFKKLFGSEWNFLSRYCGASQISGRWSFEGASNSIELNDILRASCYIRRLKADVLKELPDKVARTVLFQVDLDKYNKDVRESMSRLTSGMPSLYEEQTFIADIKRIAAEHKLNACIEWIREFINSGRKLVVFAWHKSIISQIEAAFPGIYVKVDGSVSNVLDQGGVSERQRAVNAFQEDEKIRLFIGNIKAAGVGLTLTAASDVAFIEFMFTPSDHAQAEDRCHRIGQKNSVTAWYLVAEGTIDEDMIEILGVRQENAHEALDGRFDNKKNRTDLKRILKNIRNANEAENQSEVELIKI